MDEGVLLFETGVDPVVAVCIDLIYNDRSILKLSGLLKRNLSHIVLTKNILCHIKLEIFENRCVPNREFYCVSSCFFVTFCSCFRMDENVDTLAHKN